MEPLVFIVTVSIVAIFLWWATGRLPATWKFAVSIGVPTCLAAGLVTGLAHSGNTGTQFAENLFSVCGLTALNAAVVAGLGWGAARILSKNSPD